MLLGVAIGRGKKILKDREPKVRGYLRSQILVRMWGKLVGQFVGLTVKLCHVLRLLLFFLGVPSVAF